MISILQRCLREVLTQLRWDIPTLLRATLACAGTRHFRKSFPMTQIPTHKKRQRTQPFKAILKIQQVLSFTPWVISQIVCWCWEVCWTLEFLCKMCIQLQMEFLLLAFSCFLMLVMHPSSSMLSQLAQSSQPFLMSSLSVSNAKNENVIFPDC